MNLYGYPSMDKKYSLLSSGLNSLNSLIETGYGKNMYPYIGHTVRDNPGMEKNCHSDFQIDCNCFKINISSIQLLNYNTHSTNM